MRSGNVSRIVELGAASVDAEQATDLRVEPALDQIVDERLHDGGILGRPFDQAERGAYSRRSSLISDPIISPGVFPQPSAAKFQVL